MKSVLLAVPVKVMDYEWSAPAETVQPAPEVVRSEHTPKQPATISAEQLEAHIAQYVDRLLADPNWHAEQARKQEEKAARQRAREERLAARRLRKAA